MYTVYYLQASTKETAIKFSSTDNYFVIDDTTTHRGYGITLEEAISDADEYCDEIDKTYKIFLSSLYVIAEVDDLNELESLYPEHFI